jgi:hypothetical protein
LIDDDELAMDNPLIQAAARESVGSETNLLRQVLSIRNYVYDKLSYAVTPAIETPDVVLLRGRGSCGEYVGLLLALMRLNGIACRTWVATSALPTPTSPASTSNPTSTTCGLSSTFPALAGCPWSLTPTMSRRAAPTPTRFLMGLPWWHVEMGKGIPFEKLIRPADGPEARLGRSGRQPHAL